MIAGLQKMTLLDFPGKVACTVFLQGCNFRCPFCHNTDLLPHEGEEFLTLEGFSEFLKTRKGLIDAVCVSGGEPTLAPELFDLFSAIKDQGYAAKLDTNGMRPDVLKQLVEKKLIDYVAMDIKSSPSRYAHAAGLPQIAFEKIVESVAFLLTDAVDYELRTTVVSEIHDEACIQEMGEWLASVAPPKKAKKLFLQAFQDRETVAFSGLSTPSDEVLQAFKRILSPYVEQVAIRGE